MALKRKNYLLDEETLKDMEILRQRNRHLTMTEVIRAAINLYWKNTFRYGTDPHTGGSDIGITIENQAERKVKLKLAKEKVEQDLKLKPKIDLCEQQLGGEVFTYPDGSKVCRWETHDTVKSDPQELPIAQVGPYLLDNLFIPDKETVLKARPELRKKFK